MKQIPEIRRDNLERLIVEKQTLAALAEAAGTSSVYLSQIRNRSLDSKTRRPREMGAAMARRLEEVCGKPPGWMDHDNGVAFSGSTPPAHEPPAARGSDEVLYLNTVPPLKTVEEIMNGTAGEEFRFALTDDAIAPEYPRGLHLIISTTRSPKLGRPVLVKTRHGELHARIYAQGRAPGAWRACATASGYVDLLPDDGQIVGVYRGLYEAGD